MTPQTFVIRKGDQVRLANAKRLLDALLDREDVEVMVSQYSPKHTDAQRALFWVWCGYVARMKREAGMQCDEDAVHDQVLGSIFGWKQDPWGRAKPAQTLTSPRRKSKLQMIEILNQFMVWAAEDGIMLPDAGDAMKLDEREKAAAA